MPLPSLPRSRTRLFVNLSGKRKTTSPMTYDWTSYLFMGQAPKNILENIALVNQYLTPPSEHLKSAKRTQGV
jgi:hypothetical protein